MLFKYIIYLFNINILLNLKIAKDFKFLLYFNNYINALNKIYIYAFFKIAKQALFKNYKRYLFYNIFATYIFNLQFCFIYFK